MKIWKVEFEGVYPVGSCCIIAAKTRSYALKMAKRMITHTYIAINDVTEVDISSPCVIEFMSGDY